MNNVFWKRIPAYFGGVLLGLALSGTFFYMKRRMAPDFVDRTERFTDFSIQRGEYVKLDFQFEPNHHLAPGFRSEVFVGKQAADGRWKSFLHLKRDQLMATETLLGPFQEEGSYELRGSLYYCAEVGASSCVRRLLEVSFLVVDESGQRKTYVLPIPK